METFIMLGKYSSEAVKRVSPERTARAIDIIKKLGGKINSIYALLGEYDLILIAELPSVQDAIRYSFELNTMAGISFTTFPAITVEEFDKIIAD